MCKNLITLSSEYYAPDEKHFLIHSENNQHHNDVQKNVKIIVG